MPVEIVGLLVSPVHAYEGRPGDGPRPDPDGRRPEAVEVRAGLGIVGDRYFGRRGAPAAAVHVLAAESLDDIARELALPAVPDPLLTRRNVVLRGFPVDRLAAGRDTPGAVFSLDSGDGPVRFRAHRPASPCRWMDVVLAPAGVPRHAWPRRGALRAAARRGAPAGPPCSRVPAPAEPARQWAASSQLRP